MHKGSDILSSRNQFFLSFFFPAIFYWVERIKNVSLESIDQLGAAPYFLYQPSKTREGISRSFPSLCLSIQLRIHRIIFFLLFNGRRCSADDDYIGTREKKRSNAVKEEEEEKFLIKNPSILMWVWVGAIYLSLCWERLYTSNRS